MALADRLAEIRPDAASVELCRLRRAGAELLGLEQASLVGERFEIVRKLGAGGMGVVYLARDRKLDRSVALKFLRPSALGIGDRAEQRRSLREEARAAAAVSHPNLVEVYDVGEIDGQVFIAMRNLAGERLSAWSERRPSPRRIAATFAQIARGLHALHEAGLVHGDLKPANVIVDAEGQATLVDYGLARHRQDTLDEQTGPHGGTPGFIAPELEAGEFPTAKTDQYAFGVALAGVLRGSASRPLSRLATRAQSAEPGQRYASMQAVAEVLDKRRASPILATAALLVAGLGAAVVSLADNTGSVLIDPGAASPLTSTSAEDSAAAVELRAGIDARRQGRYEAAETRLTEAFAIAGGDADGSTQARAATELVVVTGALGRRPLDAAKWQRHAEAALARLGDPAALQADLLTATAASALANADYEAAQSLANRALELGSDPSAMQILASAYEERGRYTEAIAWHNEALSLVPGDPTVTMQLGKVHHSLRDFVRARVLYEDALDGLERTVGADHPEVAVVLGRLGVLAGAGGNATAAEGHHRRALQIREAALGEAHPAVADSLTLLAGALKHQHRFDEARAAYERAVAILEGELGSDDGNLAVTLGGLSDVLLRAGALDDAADVLERTIELRRRSRGARHPRVATDLSMLANVQKRRGDFDAALRSENEALAIRIEAFDPDHRLVARSRQRIRNLQAKRDAQNSKRLSRL